MASEPHSAEQPTRCAEVTWEMRDDSYGESAADAAIGDFVWHYKGVRSGHVLAREEERIEGWTTYSTRVCECGEAETGDHHVVMLARPLTSIPAFIDDTRALIDDTRALILAYKASLAREAALREALEDAEPWLVTPSDTYPQHYETLGQVREKVRRTLAASRPAATEEEA